MNKISLKKGKAKLPDRLWIAEMHYHVKPSGVRAVIENIIEQKKIQQNFSK